MQRWLPAAAITVFAAGITWLNRGERVALDIGIATFYRAPLTVVLFLAFLAGMLSMLLLSLRQDLRMREELRARGILVPSRTAAPQTPEWGRPEQPPARTEPPAEDRTVVYPRYDEDPAA